MTHDDDMPEPEGSSSLEHDRDAAEPSDSFDRRSALKKAGVGAGVVAGLVWTSPRIEGLSLRADYAQAATVPVTSDQTFTVDAASNPAEYSRSGAPAPAAHLAFSYTGTFAVPPLPSDDNAPPADDAARPSGAPGSMLAPAALYLLPLGTFSVYRSTDCPTTLDVTWEDPSGRPVTRTDNPSSGGPYTISRLAYFTTPWPGRRPTTITFHFTC